MTSPGPRRRGGAPGRGRPRPSPLHTPAGPAQPAANASAETMASAPPDQTPPNAPPAGDAKRRSASRWSLVAAGVLGAALALVVAAGAWVLAGGVPDTGGDRGGDTNARLTRIETQLGTLARHGASTGDAKPLDDLAQPLPPHRS